VTDFERLLVSSRSPAAKSLLRAGLRDAPGPDSLARAAAALGVGAGALAVAVPAAASLNGAVVGSAVAVAGKAPLASGLSALVLSKWLLVGAVGGVLVSGTAAVVEHVRAPARGVPSAQPAVRSLPLGAPSPGAPRATAGLNPVPDAPDVPTGALTPAPSAGASPGSSPALAPAPSTPSTLGVEAARVDAARRALARGEFAQALAELASYQRVRTVGVLDREALVLRIQVLVREGESERAVLLARSYLAAHPNDAYTARLEALLASNGRVWPAAAGIEATPPGH